MDPRRRTIEEAGAYRILDILFTDLRKVERTLTTIQQTVPDPERAVHLAAIRAALAQLEAFIPPPA